MPLVAFYADDFTGATDVMLQLRRCGLDGVLLLSADEAALARHAHSDVVGIAGIARSLPTADMEAEVASAFRMLWALRPRVLQYKACSTVDSSPGIGSLGRAAEIAVATTRQRSIPALFAQPDFGRFTVFGNHFAADHGTVYRLDRHPTMSRHPSTPIDEADLTLFLARQTDLPVRNLPLIAYPEDPADAPPLAEGITVLDAVEDHHLFTVGHMVLDIDDGPVFAMGSGGLSRAVGMVLGSGGLRREDRGGTTGPVLVVSGSNSPQTGRQIEHARGAGWPVRALTTDDLDRPDSLRDWALATLADGGRGVVHSRDLPATTPDLLARLAALYTDLLRTTRAGTPELTAVVCGGDTSSRILRSSGAEALEIDRVVVDNVMISRLLAPGHWADRLPILLKGGQVGRENLFEIVRKGPNR